MAREDRMANALDLDMAALGVSAASASALAGKNRKQLLGYVLTKLRAGHLCRVEGGAYLGDGMPPMKTLRQSSFLDRFRVAAGAWSRLTAERWRIHFHRERFHDLMNEVMPLCEVWP